MPKILRILNRLNIGGPSYNVAYLSKYLNPQFETRVLAGMKEPFEGSSEYILNDLGVDFQYIPHMHRQLNPINDFLAYNNIKKIITKYQPDIVHTHAAKAGALGRIAASRSQSRPKAIVHTYHGNVFDGYFSPLKTKIFLGIERYLCRLSTAVVAISDKQKNDLVEKYKIVPEEKVHVIKLGFDLEKFTLNRDTKRKQFRGHYQIDDDTVVISITGRLTAVKNHTLIVDSIKYLKDHNPLSKVRLFIVGDGELLPDIIQHATDRGLSICLPDDTNYQTDIIFTSWRKDIDVINAGSDIIALTSLNEGTPVSIIEALASKKAVICTNVGGISDVVSHQVNGILSGLEMKNFSEKLQNLVENKQLRIKLAEEAEKNVFQQYSYTRLINDMHNLYNRIL